MADYDACIGLGSNMGDKRAHIARAIEYLTGAGDIHLVARSRDYRSAAWGKTDQDWFVNACIAVVTNLSAHELLKRCLDTEQQLGRVRNEHWGPRVIDCDLLVFRDVHLNTPELTLPHPRITERAFVMVPMLEMGPDLVLNGRRISSWLNALNADDVVAIE